MRAGGSVAIVDYGMGNRRSVEKALDRVGARTLLTSDPDALAGADGIVLPGVGAFPEAMRRLRESGLDQVLCERAAAGTPLLGICLGMQLLFDSSDEHDGATGLGLLPGAVEALPAPGLKLPHIGWNLVRWSRPSPLTDGLPDACAFYHVHSYAVRAGDDGDVLGWGEYGTPFVSAVARESLFGVQFHPEKSSAHGLRLLESFTAICASTPAP
jgi:imidazole glycerol-phosphate synthase subunit HisH